MADSDLKLKRWYNYYNRKYFNNELPQDTVVFWQPMAVPVADVTQESDAWGDWTQLDDLSFVIRLEPRLEWSPRLARICLIHEMCHIKAGVGAGHGKRFNAEIKRLFDSGAYKTLL